MVYIKRDIKKVGSILFLILRIYNAGNLTASKFDFNELLRDKKIIKQCWFCFIHEKFLFKNIDTVLISLSQ